MAKKFRKFHPDFKFKVVLDSFVSGNVSETARKYDIHPNLISTWRKQFMTNGSRIFDSKNIDTDAKYRKKVEQLENLIGKKEVEVNLLKKYLDFYAPQDGS